MWHLVLGPGRGAGVLEEPQVAVGVAGGKPGPVVAHVDGRGHGGVVLIKKLKSNYKSSNDKMKTLPATIKLIKLVIWSNKLVSFLYFK